MDDRKELPQPEGIETREVGAGARTGDRDFHRLGFLGTPERMKIARVVHEANRAYCQSIGDTSQVPFDDAPAWQIESALKGIDGITSGEITRPSQSHEAWYAEKAATGWTFGRVKDEVAKTHPCMVPYDELAAEQRMKDHLFLTIVRTLTSDIG